MQCDTAISKLLKEIANYVDNISDINFILSYVNDDWLDELKPLCKNARSASFDYHSWQSHDYQYDFVSMFPRVERLIIGGNVCDLTDNENYCIPSLKVIKIVDNYNIDNDALYSIMESNPQLETIMIDMDFWDTDVLPMVKFIPIWHNLAELSISWFNIDIETEMHLLMKLEKLTRLTFTQICARGVEVDNFLNGLLDFDRLKSVKLCLREYEEMSEADQKLFQPKAYYVQLAKIARKMKSLEQFHITNCPLTEMFCLDFVASATNLKRFHIHKSDLKEFQPDFLDKLKIRGNAELKINFVDNCKCTFEWNL